MFNRKSPFSKPNVFASLEISAYNFSPLFINTRIRQQNHDIGRWILWYFTMQELDPHISSISIWHLV